MAASTRNPYYGKMASNQRIGENVEKIVEFDRRFQQALQGHDRESLLHLASWAETHGLTLARKAQQAAQNLS